MKTNENAKQLNDKVMEEIEAVLDNKPKAAHAFR